MPGEPGKRKRLQNNENNSKNKISSQDKMKITAMNSDFKSNTTWRPVCSMAVELDASPGLAPQ
jgi:hypothetical protein